MSHDGAAHSATTALEKLASMRQRDPKAAVQRLLQLLAYLDDVGVGYHGVPTANMLCTNTANMLCTNMRSGEPRCICGSHAPNSHAPSELDDMATR